jgi:hypothetical protein
MLATSTVHRSPPKPGWQTDELEDEWVEPSSSHSHNHDNQHSNHSPSHSLSIVSNGRFDDVAPPNSTLSRLTALPSPTPPGTFLIREDQPPPILPKPLGKGRGKGLIKDFFSPLALETMFEPPSPKVVQDTLPAMPSRPAPFYTADDEQHERSAEEESREAEEQAGDEGLGEGDMEEETRPLLDGEREEEVEEEEEEEEEEGGEDVILASDIPNLASFDGRRPSLAYKFTFSAPPRTRVPNPVPEGTPSPSPTPSKSTRPLQLQAPTTDPRLRLFQFQYDTFTREHLSAMVDSIAVHTPSDSSKSKSPANLLSRIHSREEHSSTLESSDAGYLRATKRLKLTPPQDLSDGEVAVRHKLRRDYVGESRNLMQKIKQARSASMMTTASVKENIQPTNVEDQSTVEDRPRRLPFGDRA